MILYQFLYHNLDLDSYFILVLLKQLWNITLDPELKKEREWLKSYLRLLLLWPGQISLMDYIIPFERNFTLGFNHMFVNITKLHVLLHFHWVSLQLKPRFLINSIANLLLIYPQMTEYFCRNWQTKQMSTIAIYCLKHYSDPITVSGNG